MDVILFLLIVLLHRGYSTCNIMGDGTSCRLAGFIDWAEAEICPFGQNLYSLQVLTSALHLMKGWRQYEGYGALQDTFWSMFQNEVGVLSAGIMKTIKTAMIWAYCGLVASRKDLQICRRPLLSVTMRRDVITCYLWTVSLLMRLQNSMTLIDRTYGTDRSLN